MAFNQTAESVVANQLVCPFDPAHTIEPGRYAVHLTKCQQTHNSKKKMKVCPFNCVHLVTEAELEKHIKECPNRKEFDNYKYTIGETDAVVGSSVPIPVIIDDDEECWETNVTTSYIPKPNDDIMVIPHGAKPAERKAFRKKKRQEFFQNENN